MVQPAENMKSAGGGTPPVRILVVEDELRNRSFLEMCLQSSGYDVLLAQSGEEARRLVTTEDPDLVVLDLGLPDMDGKTLLKNIRGWSDMPILILSARMEEEEKVLALDAGANDYVVKPFGVAELQARVRRLLRSVSVQERDAGQSTYEKGPLRVDFAARQVFMRGRPVRLSRKEFDILRLFCLYPDRVLTHRQILSEVWGENAADDIQYLRVYIGQLRRKLECPGLFVTVSGVGYRMATGLADGDGSA